MELLRESPVDPIADADGDGLDGVEEVAEPQLDLGARKVTGTAAVGSA